MLHLKTTEAPNFCHRTDIVEDEVYKLRSFSPDALGLMNTFLPEDEG